MLNNAFEWERLIHPNPTDDMVERRKAIVSSVLETFDSEKEIGEVFRLVSAALMGLSPAIAADVDYGKMLTETTKIHNVAFPLSLSENALDLQVTACLAVGELLTRKPAKQSWMAPRTTIASLCVSTAGFAPIAKGLHLNSIRDALLTTSRQRLASEAKIIRKRPKFDAVAELDELSPSGDTATFWVALRPFLESAFDSLRRASEIDRDELEVLWWLYNNESGTFGKLVSDMNLYDVAFAAPIELVDRAMCPAPASLTRIVEGLVGVAPGKSGGGGKALKSVLEAWTVEVIRALLPEDEALKKLVSSSPRSLPLTWIAGKIVDSGVTKGWEAEFASRTGLNPSMKITANALANQVFAERTAQRLLSEFVGEES